MFHDPARIATSASLIPEQDHIVHKMSQNYHPHHPYSDSMTMSQDNGDIQAEVNAGDDAEGSNEQTAQNNQVKKKRKKVNHACLYCRRSHMTCDDGRPCQRCIKRDIGHLCRDEAKPSTGASGSAKQEPVTSMSNVQGNVLQHTPLSIQPSFQYNPPGSNPLAQRPMQSPVVPSPHTSQNSNSWSMTPTTSHGWGSESLGNEFSMLTEFLESLDDRSFFGAPSTTSGPSVPLPPQPRLDVNTMLSNQASTPRGYPHPSNHGQLHTPLQTQHPPNMLHQRQEQHPSQDPNYAIQSAASKTEQFLMTAADQQSGTRDERLAKVIQAKYEAGLLKPYNYVKGYRRLSTWMERNVSPASRQAIQQPLAMLRPKFRAVAQNLTDLDLVFIEEAFERLLLDYDRVFSAMGIPACLWRRTGEIYKGNREFANLIGVNFTDLVDGRLAIYELMSEESAVNLWEKYGHVAFDTGQKGVLTSCVLRYKPREVNPQASQSGPPQEGYVNCCFSMTIRRDSWGIPVAIVGNFISY
ncbi:hypothetical protein FS842_001171 [Serendipita sp. 407]|nr:hypothetical protein FS842_001171 [Serendipita sp. 407]